MNTLLDIRQSSQYAEFMRRIGWQVENAAGVNIFIRQLPLIGSLIKVQRPSWPIPFEQIEAVARKYRAHFVKIEPNIPSTSDQSPMINDYRPDSWPLLPTKTVWINLQRPPEDIVAAMDKDTRYAIRSAQKNAVTIVQSNDIAAFVKGWERNAHDRGFWVPFSKELRLLWESFGSQAIVLLAHTPRNSDPVAGALILHNSTTASYLHAFSTPIGRHLSAPSLIIDAATELSKKLGCAVLDLEGIYDPRFHQATKKWHGFTHFKMGFGGEVVSYPAPIIHKRSLLGKLF